MNATLQDALNRAVGDQGTLVAAVQALYRRYPDPCDLLGVEEFTLRELQLLHEAVLEHPLPKDGFRRTMAKMLVPTGFLLDGEIGKPAQLWRKPDLTVVN
jgi:8-oxo-dGTP diphosphatase